MTLSFQLARFSGSTLEPSSEPIMIYEPQYYRKGSGRATHITLVPTRPTPSLKRNDKPPHILIPTPNFDDMHIDDNEFSAWSYEEESTSFLWDSITCTATTNTFPLLSLSPSIS